jgi:carbonic anhydrase/acetyltransferase-like protein (isoleucine patch superfamily)
MGSQIAEIDQHPIAHVLGDKAVEAADRIGHGAVVVADQLPEILRIKTRRECRRADEVAEHHRQLPAFGVDSRR